MMHVSFEELEECLKFDKNELDEALLEQPELFDRVAKQTSLALSRRDEAKALLKQIEASTYLNLREHFSKTGVKITEDLLKNEVTVSPEVKKALSAFIKAEGELSLWEGLKESFKQRHYAIQTSAELYTAGYFGNTSVGSSQQKYDAQRRALAEERRKTRSFVNGDKS